MKNLKLIILFVAILFVSPLIQAQSKVKVPEKLQGFWNWKVANSGDWDCTTIGADYVEYFYKIYYIDKITEQGTDGYHLWLQHEAGEQIELTFFGLGNKQAKLQFSKWDAPKDCQLSVSPPNTEKILPGKLPKALFQEWTSDNKGTLFCKFHDANKLLYENKEWDIVSTGYYMEKEYRMLIRSGNRYKLIYLNNLTDQSLRLVSNANITLLTPIATNKDVYKILGNWVEKNKNSWEIGFFEKFAIYKGDFWNYKSIVFNGETANIMLAKGTDQLKLTLVLKSDVLCEVAITGQQPKTYIKCGKNMPAYTTADTKSFKDTRFQKTDSVTIKGYIRNNPSKQPFSIRFTDPITEVQAVFFADVDASGLFTIKFPLINTTELLVDWGRMNKGDVAEPGENYFLFFDFSSNQYLFMGDNERLHNEMAGYKPYSRYENFSAEDSKRNNELAPLEFLTVQKDILRKGYSHLNEYIANNPNLSERFKYYQRNYYRFMAARELMQRQFSLNNSKNGFLPAVFMKYIDDSLYQNTPVLPFTLVSGYLTFMRYYTGYSENKYTEGSLLNTAIFDIIRNIQKDDRLKLTDEEKQVLTKFEEYDKIYIKFYREKADSTQRSEAVKPFNEDFNKMLRILNKEEVKKYMTEESASLVNQLQSRGKVYSKWAVLDSLVSDPRLKELLEVRKFYFSIYENQRRLPDADYQEFKEKITSPALAAPIIILQNHYSQLSKQDIFYAESLKKTDHLIESKDADVLLAQLTAPYKGKVVYMDFWGTWCSPCMQQMKYVGAVKEAFKNKDVIFMYFASTSPEDSWKNAIKENNLTGPNVVHYRLTGEQQAMIERRLSVSGFPTYILMDKMGKVVNMNAPRPEEKVKLVQEITNLLN